MKLSRKTSSHQEVAIFRKISFLFFKRGFDYVPMVIPYPGAPGAPMFDGKNITHFLHLYDQLCSDYRLSESEKIYRLPWYCEFFIGRYIRILIKGADWTAARSILRKEYKDNDLDQLMSSREFLEALKKKARSEDDDHMHYCQLFASIYRDLILRKRLDLYSQCQWFLQGLLERVVMEIFYRHDIDLEDDDSLDFEDLLEKALVIIRRRKYLADFIQDKEIDLVNKYIESLDKVPTHSNIVEPLSNPNPPTRFQTVQRAVPEDVPIVRIHSSRIEEVKASKVSSSDDAYIFVSGPTEDFYENLEVLFAKLMDEDLEQVGVSSVEPLKQVEGTRIGIQRLNIKRKKTVHGLIPQTLKKDTIGTKERRYPGPGGLMIGRPVKKVIKSEDHV